MLQVPRPSYWLPLPILLLVAGLGWQAGARRWPYLLPPLQDVWHQLAEDPGYFTSAAGHTLTEALLGLLIALVVGFLLAVLVSEVPIARRAIMPVAVVLNVTPLVAIAPALVVAFGFGITPKLIVTALICFFPILINTSVGLRSVPGHVLRLLDSMAATRWQKLVHVRVPLSVPHLLAALQIVFPLSVVGAVVAELSAAGANGGLGTVIAVASSMNRLAVVWAAIFVLALMGALLLFAVSTLQRLVMRRYRRTAEFSG
ncbi:ABC transporter permease [Nocardioides sp.]|uniref:ABC transporter permease n=1 Tax=Nocardioides sp. TaxID=35761 RepID=UPI0039E5E783